MDESPDPLRRRAARVLLLDPRHRLLLFPYDPVDDGDDHSYWYLPGGWMLPGEGPAAAAARELMEETGLEPVLGPVVCRRRGIRFRLQGRTVVQDEWLLIARTDVAQVSPQPGDGEASAAAKHRWWALDELEATTDTIHPAGLPQVIRRLLADGPPEEPWDLP